jgi:ABC-type phosphate/phosphonate transport system substrate-binding protein
METTRANAPVSTALLLGLIFSGSAFADNFTFTVEPSYPPEQAEEVYKPLLDYLTRTTGHTFELVTTRNYHLYWRDLRKAKPVDFAYEEAHFVDYRGKRFGFEPLVRKQTPTVFTVLANYEFEEDGLSGLVGRRIVTMPSPSLGFTMLAEMYDNPISQPDFRSEASSWRDGVEMVFAGDAEAAMVPDFIAEQYPNLASLESSRPYPGAAVNAGPTVSAEAKAAVRDALLKLHEDPDAFSTLAELGVTEFIPATAEDFAGRQDILAGFFGYVAANGDAENETVSDD